MLATSTLAIIASGQRVEGSLGVNGGSSTDQRGLRSNAGTLAANLLVIPDPRVSFSLGASGTRFQASGWSASGVAASGVRLPIAGGLALAASASGAAVTTSWDARYLSAEATPTLEATLSRVTLFGGARFAQGRATTPPANSVAPSPLGTPAVSSTSTTLTSTGPVFGAVVALPTANPDASARLVYREERAMVAGVSLIDRTIGANWATGALSLGATAGSRDAREERAQFGGVSAGVDIAHGVGLQAAVGSYVSSRTLGTPGGRYATLGLLLHGVRATDQPHENAVRSAPRPAPGTTRLMLRAPQAHRVALAGNWNEWAKMPATRAEDGTWYADVPLPRGEYRYAFMIDGERWAVPDGVTTVDDGFGGRSALLTVP